MTDSADAPVLSRSLVTLAKQLRDGPLQDLAELHRQTTRLSLETTTSTHERLQQLTELAVVSLAAMEQFQAFTRELRSQIAELATAPEHELH